MDFQKSLGVKGYCFREFKDPVTLARMVRECGVDRLDVSACNVNLDSREAQERLLGALADAGITVTGLGVVVLRGEEAFDRRYFEFCKNARCDTISMHFEPAVQDVAISTISKLCDEYRMRCAIHNHGGSHWLGNRAILRHLFSHIPPSIGLCLDTAWAVDASEDPVEWAKEAGPRLMATHLKDYVFDRKGVPSDVVLGTGTLDLPAYLQTLRAIEFNGPFVIEYEGDPSNPVPALRRCVEAVRQVLRDSKP